MRKNAIFITLFFVVCCQCLTAQTLYTPGGAAAIGTSTNSNVGIGTTNSPAEKLTVKGNLRIEGVSGVTHSQLSFYRASGHKFATIGQGDLNADNSTFDIAHYNGNDIRFLQSGVEAMRIMANGNVGVGTSAPLGTFQVSAARPIIMKNNGGQSIWGSEIGFNAVLNTTLAQPQFKKLGGTAQMGGAAIVVDYWGNMFFQMHNAGNENESVVSYNPSVSFTNNGRVGVGTITPQTLLNVNLGAGDVSAGTPALRIGGANNYASLEFGIKGNYDGMISTYGNDLHVYAGNWRTAGATATENHNISFYTSQAGSTNWNTPKVYLRSDGNLGIGTVNPDAKLAVKGTIHSEEVKVDLNVPVPDYVFEESYNLSALSEVENYIKQNKHLPEVPAAKEIEANGIYLGQMDMLLLKKVEELTLYAIEQQKEINEQKKNIQILLQKVKMLEQGK